ncbi:MAG: amino acid adenylation domain-containing protein, partial [Acidobacteriota bacterium]
SEGPVSRIILGSFESESPTLSLDFPALCADELTLERLVAELAAAYEGRSLAGEVLQYADLAEWWNELPSKSESKPGIEYWRRLATSQEGVAGVRSLPFECSAEGITSLVPARVRSGISGATLEGFDRVCAHLNTSPALFLLTCWEILLRRLSPDGALTIGRSTDGRGLEELKNALGPCGRYLPMRARPFEGMSFREALDRLAADVQEQDKWADLYAPEQETSGAAGSDDSDFFWAFHYGSAGEPPPGWRFQEIRVRSERFQARLTCWRTIDNLALDLDYNAGALRGEEASLLAARFLQTLESALENPDSRAEDLEILPQEERQLLWSEWNQTQKTFTDDRPLYQRFSEVAQRIPGEIALVCGERRLTYSELNDRANKIAHRLIAAGVGPDVLVGLCIDRSAEMVIGLLGIWKAGGAYVPLDPALPSERMSFLLDDTAVRFLLTRGSLAGRFRSSLVQTFLLDDDESGSSLDPDPSARPKHLAYVIFTSGSTGRPKGVAVEHRQISNYVNAVVERLAPAPRASFATVTTLSADLGNTSLFPSLALGGRLHVVLEEASSDPEHLAEDFDREPVDYLKIVPSHLAALLSGSRPEKILPARCLVLGGEAPSRDLIELIRTVAPECRVVNHYGPTEATIGATTFEIPVTAPPAGHPISIGRPLANCRAYILDPAKRAAPIGVAGELHLAGAGLARGYLGRPELTAERFIQVGVGPVRERLYRTGDLARYRPDGNIELLGRTDDQVKLHGFRIEPGEIEAALRQHAAVREAVVLPVDYGAGVKKLVAYLVAQAGQTLAPAELRSFLVEKLPEFMVPSAFLQLARLPLTPNGKIDRGALPRPAPPGVDADSAMALPETDAEKALSKVWSEVLRIPRFGIHDNFFELGGDSILAIQIIARAARVGLRLSPRQLFEHQTIAELARVAGTVGEDQSGEQGAVVGSVPLTPIQRWFFEREFEDPHHFNQSVFLEFREALDSDTAARAMDVVAAHHDALRLRFARDSSAGWQQTNAAPAAGPAVPVVHLHGLSEAEKKVRVEEAARLAHEGLDLTRGPLSRAVAFDDGPDAPFRLLWVVHHLAVDTVSWRVLIEDFERAYEQLATNQVPSLPPKTTSYRQWAGKLVDLAASGALRQEGSFWLSTTEGPSPPLERDARGENTFGSARSVTSELSEEETGALLKEVPAAFRTRINDALLSALLDAFRSWTGRPSLLIDLEAHGREDVIPELNLSRTVGWFTARFPVRLESADQAGPGDRLAAVREQLRAIPRHGIGYGLLRYLAPAQSAAAISVTEPEVSFNYLGQADQLLDRESKLRVLPSIGASRSPRAHRPHLLYIEARVLGGRLRSSWVYSENLHRRETIETLAARFGDSLRELTALARSGSSIGYSPSDFPNARLDQDDLNTLLASIKTSPGSGR